MFFRVNFPSTPLNVWVFAIILYGSSGWSVDGNSIFYRIQKNGVISYILGTTHRHDISLSDLDPVVEESLLRSRLLLAELKGGSWRPLHPRESQGQFMDQQRRLVDWFTPYQKMVLTHYLDRLGLEDPMLEARLRPFLTSHESVEKFIEMIYLVELMRAMSVWQDHIGLNALPTPLDFDVVRIAKENKIRTVSLDNPATRSQALRDQFSSESLDSFLTLLLERDQESDVGYTLLGREFMRQYWDPELRELYVSNQPHRLVHRFYYTGGIIHRLRDLDLALLNRDHYWWDYILRETSTRSVFIAVGLAHVIPQNRVYDGELSLLERFVNSGFTVEAVSLRRPPQAWIPRMEALRSCHDIFQ